MTLAPNPEGDANPVESADPSRERVIVWSIVAFVVWVGTTRLVPHVIRALGLDHGGGATAIDPVFHSIVSCATLTFFAIYGARNAPEGWTRRLLLVRPPVSPTTLVLILLANGGVLILEAALYAVITVFIKGSRAPDWWAVFRGSSLGWQVAMMLGSVLGPALGEELLFRGYMQEGLLKSLRPSLAMLVTAVLFSAGHLDPIRSVAMIPHALWLGFLAVRTRSLVPSMLCHALTNLTPMLMGITETNPVTVAGIQSLVGAPAFVLALRALRRPSPTDSVPPVTG